MLRYAALIEEAQGRRFEWGAWDCCQFAARDVEAVTGRDPRELFPPYTSEAEAESIIAECGGMQELITRALGESVQPSRAMRGDIVLCDMGRGLQPAVCTGVYCVAPGARGLERRASLDALAAWNL